MLMTVKETANKIKEGKNLFLAGDETLLRQLSKGQWIGGTIPYFMTTDKGGLENSTTHIFAYEAPDIVEETKIISYNKDNLQNIPADAFDNGFSLIIIPAISQTHFNYAQNSPTYKGIFFKPIIGWISGVHVKNIGNMTAEKITAKVFNGETAKSTDQDAIVMHLSLPIEKVAEIKILNIFKQGYGDHITFDKEGFKVKDCYINGKKQNFSRYLSEQKVDNKLPLVADYYGTRVNVGLQYIDEDANVHFYGPIFKHVTYKIAAPVSNYVTKFQKILPKAVVATPFACNCILNYLYGELEGKKTSSFEGPISFGQIAYQLLNQTLVYLEIKDR
jgi:hypothetical protein